MFWAKTSPVPVATTDLGEIVPPMDPAATRVPSEDATAGVGGVAGTSGSTGAAGPTNQPDTSATSSVVRWAKSDTAPSPPRRTMARLAMVCHVRSVLRFDVDGRAVSAGYA